MTSTAPRPSAVTVACGLLSVGAALLLLAGAITATVSFGTLRKAQPPSVSDQSVNDLVWLNRGAGILFVVGALALVWLAARARTRDVRARRAAMTLALTLVVLVSVASVYGGHVLALLSLLPLILGTLLLSRPGVVEWYAGE